MLPSGLPKADAIVTVSAPAEFVAKQVIDVFNGRLVKRQVDLKSLSWDKPQAASGGSVRVVGHIVQGIDKECAKSISKDIRDLELKVKATVEDGQLFRVARRFQRRAPGGYRLPS